MELKIKVMKRKNVFSKNGEEWAVILYSSKNEFCILSKSESEKPTENEIKERLFYIEWCHDVMDAFKKEDTIYMPEDYEYID